MCFTGRPGAVRLCRWSVQQKQQSLEFTGEISLKHTRSLPYNSECHLPPQKKILLHRLQAPVSLPDIFSGFNSYDAGDPHSTYQVDRCILLNHLGVTECKRTTLYVNGGRSICVVVFLG